jgi:copper chaperone CopZ
MKGKKLVLLVVAFTLVVLGAAWFLVPSGLQPANAALAEYQIDKLTCGACVSNIQDALSGINGVGEVEVNLTSNRGRVTYDPVEADSQLIADTITSAGYPATLRMELSAEEYSSMRQEQASLGQKYMAKIGDRLLSREDFEAAIRQRAGDAVPVSSDERVWQQTWRNLLERELLMAAAEENNVIVQPGEVDVRVEELTKDNQGLEQLVIRRYGSMEQFRSRLHEDMIINQNIENHVLAGITDDNQRKRRLNAWYAELQKNTEVIIYDTQLKSISQASGGCACCNS